MKYIKLLVLILFLIYPLMIYADNTTVEICKSGCQFDDLSQAWNYVANNVISDSCDVQDESEMIFIFKDSETYNADFTFYDYSGFNQYPSIILDEIDNICIDDPSGNESNSFFSRIKIIGNGNQLRVGDTRLFVDDSFYIENIKFLGTNNNSELVITGGGHNLTKDFENINTSFLKNCSFENLKLNFVGKFKVDIADSVLGPMVIADSTYNSANYGSVSSQKHYYSNINISNSLFYNSGYERNVLSSDKTILTNKCLDNYCSRIIVEKEEKQNLKLDENGSINLNTLFSESDLNNNFSYVIEDPSILKIENNTIIPLKTGTTTIQFLLNDDIYNYFVSVVKENPKTSNNEIVNVPDTALQKGKKLIVIGIVFLIIGLSMQLLVFKKVINKN